MLKLMKNILTAIVLVLIVNSASLAQQTTPVAQTKTDDDFVTEKGFKSKVFTINNRDVGNLASVLRPLLSGFKGAAMSGNLEFKTLTVRDFPENLATIEEAIKRLDVPAAPRANIELHMHIIVASNTGGTTAQVPAELKDVLKQLRATLNYQHYELATSVIQRLTETQRGLRGKGTAEVSGAPSSTLVLPYEYMINSVSLVQNSTGAQTIQINEFAFITLSEKSQAQVQTALNLRDGEKVVVGTATIRDRALIVVLTATMVN